VVHDVMRLMEDGAAIYFLGVSYGSTVKNNLIHHVEHGVGIYLDEGGSGIHVLGNTLYRCLGGLFVHGGRNNLFENNKVAHVRDCLVRLGNCHSYMSDNRFRRNIFYSASEAPLLKAGGWTRRVVVDSGENLFFRADGKPFAIEGVTGIANLDEWIAAGYETGPVREDPRFADPEHDDYRLLPGSPAIRLGFSTQEKIV